MKTSIITLIFTISISSYASCFNNSCEVTYSQCLYSANKMPSNVGEERLRIKCFASFKNQITFNECLDNADGMPSNVGNENLRIKCLEHCL